MIKRRVQSYDNYKAKLKGKENSANSEPVRYGVAVRNTIVNYAPHQMLPAVFFPPKKLLTNPES